jgi:site-specific recombinase XerD
MARNIRSVLETRTQRLKLAPRKKSYTATVGPGLRLGYRRRATAGRWSVICADGAGGNWLKAFADADDFQDGNGKDVLTYWQAIDRARVLARGETETAGDNDRPSTIAEALAAYEADLKSRGGDISTIARVRIHLPTKLMSKPVALLSADHLKQWRNGLRRTLAAGSIDRIANALRAALNMVADSDKRVSRHAWEVGLKAVVQSTVARNVILPPEQIRRIVTVAYDISPEFGLLVETAATTGARVSQLARLEVSDVQSGRADPRLMMPSSRKGKGMKISHQPVAVPEALALRLKQMGKSKAGDDPLLVKPSGEPWRRSDHTRLFARAVTRAGLDPAKITIYALRHSNIVRQLRCGVPIRVVAVAHDTSVLMIERNYSKDIASHVDDLVRPTLLDLSKPTSGNVVPPAGRNQH